MHLNDNSAVQPDMEPFAKRSSEGAIIFRVACPSDKTGPIIGKVSGDACSCSGVCRLRPYVLWRAAYADLPQHFSLPFTQGGAVIRDIRESTGCKITIGDAPPGLQERGVVILSQDRWVGVPRLPVLALSPCVQSLTNGILASAFTGRVRIVAAPRTR